MSITIYDHANFKGKRDKLKTGVYPTLNPDPAVRPIIHGTDSVPALGIDKLSSVVVAPGTYAEFFITQGFRDGSFLLFEGKYPQFGKQNNKIDAIKVFDHDKTIFPIIEFYEGHNFKGFQQNLAGTGQVTNYDSPFFRHDVFSSVKVPKGVTVTLFKDSFQKGHSLTLESGDYPNLSIFGFNDVVSSLQIIQNNLEVTNIEYTNIKTKDGEPILISSTAQNGSNLEQQANITLERSYEESFTRSFSESTLFGLEISTTASVGVSAGPLSASVEQTVTSTFEKTFTFGKEESKTKTITVSKELNVNIPPGNIAKAVMTLTPQEATIEALYTLRLRGTKLTTKQKVIIESKSASTGTVVIEKFTPISE
ncbi:beta/gamma crystallin-related protein [Aquimarina sp. AU474]|uniref:beta/gamma crystallin-related protein n=1 Tax=Aquimarina sp. AU474 TaxID=2108529 RepID=UPI000D69F2DB|nr:beta/gamma crystallin-related protein [Aquimarina sp. AU474]